jgi:CheY-like chemotaxis protein
MTIMIIDDDADDRSMFAEALMEINVAVHLLPMDSCEKAIDYFNNKCAAIPDFIFLDINMPTMNGWQCLDQIRNMAKTQHIPVVIYTTSQSEENYEKIKNMEAMYFLSKPSKFKELIGALTLVMDREWEKLDSLIEFKTKKK